MELPTIWGSAPNRERHSPSLRRTSAGAPFLLASEKNVRPISGFSPSREKTSGVTTTVLTTLGLPRPVSVRSCRWTPAIWANAPLPSRFARKSM